MKGTLFDEDACGWNVNELDTPLKQHRYIPGVSDAMLYFGSWKSIFAFHTEDFDLHSVNYLHTGRSGQIRWLPVSRSPHWQYSLPAFAFVYVYLLYLNTLSSSINCCYSMIDFIVYVNIVPYVCIVCTPRCTEVLVCHPLPPEGAFRKYSCRLFHHGETRLQGVFTTQN